MKRKGLLLHLLLLLILPLVAQAETQTYGGGFVGAARCWRRRVRWFRWFFFGSIARASQILGIHGFPVGKQTTPVYHGSSGLIEDRFVH